MTTVADSKCILLVDDDEDLLASLSYDLKDGGYDVTPVTNLTDAGAALADKSYHCIILDIRLKAESGEDLVQSVLSKEHEKNLETPIIVISGNLEVDGVMRMQERVTDFLMKPFTADDLLWKLKEIIPQ